MPKKRAPLPNAYYEFCERQKAEAVKQNAERQHPQKQPPMPPFPKSAMVALQFQKAKASREARHFSSIGTYDSLRARKAQRRADKIRLAISTGKHNDGSIKAIRLHRDWLAEQPASIQKKYDYIGLNSLSEGAIDYSTRRPGNKKLNGRHLPHQN